MKKSRIFILMLVFIFGVGGCSSSSYDYTVQYRDISQSKIFVDYEENVMYTWYKNGYGAGMSVMLRANGLPKLFDPIDSKYTTVYDISKAKIFVDFETNVMYAWYKNGYGAGMSVMLKANGLPKLYTSSTKYTKIDNILKSRLFVDYEEYVMYAWYKNGYGAGMSVMLDADGTAKTFQQ